jgi:hypothetical protein
MNTTELIAVIILGFTFGVAPIIIVVFEYFTKKEKEQARVEKIKLQNKITKDITYSQLKSESKHKDIKNKLEIFQKLVKLEEEMKSKKTLTINDQKKLESLEMIKKEFKETFAEKQRENLKLGVRARKIIRSKKRRQQTNKKNKTC